MNHYQDHLLLMEEDLQNSFQFVVLRRFFGLESLEVSEDFFVLVFLHVLSIAFRIAPSTVGVVLLIVVEIVVAFAFETEPDVEVVSLETSSETEAPSWIDLKEMELL